MKTKVIALDIYGTVLSSIDYENAMPPRKGFKEFVERCQSLEIPLVTTSDSDLTMLRLDLEQVLKRVGLTPDIFDESYQLDTIPKNYSQLITDYQIQPSQLFVIGDNYGKDIRGAEEIGCRTFQVPEYNTLPDDFDFSQINIP